MSGIGSEKRAFTVSEINQLLHVIIEQTHFTEDIWICGDIVQVNYYAKGQHYYLTLSDGTCVMNAVIYASFASRLSSPPKKGQHVFARGKMTCYQKKGSVMFQIAYLSEKGVGVEKKKLDALKKQLDKEGLFLPERKQVLPLYPECIGLITSPHSAAMWDFVTTLRKSTSFCRILVIPAIMQGTQSAFSLIEALDKAVFEKVDLISVVRGGGSVEDLSTFNDEGLVRKIASLSIPIQVGIGHQTDTSLCDFVADDSQATPTACAEQIGEAFSAALMASHTALQRIGRSVDSQIFSSRDQVETGLQRFTRAMDACFSRMHERVRSLLSKTTAVNPLARLSNGYCIGTVKKKRLKSVKTVSVNDILISTFHDGQITSAINGITHD